MIIGITGSSGSGKTIFSNFFKDDGFFVFNCDNFVKELYNNQDFINIIQNIFPEVIINNKINKKHLSTIVFSNPSTLEKFNNSVFPFISEKIIEGINIINKTTDNIILDAPTLFETGLYKKCNFIIGIIANKTVKLKRIMERDNISKEEALSRLSYQKKINFIIEIVILLLKIMIQKKNFINTIYI